MELGVILGSRHNVYYGIFINMNEDYHKFLLSNYGKNLVLLSVDIGENELSNFRMDVLDIDILRSSNEMMVLGLMLMLRRTGGEKDILVIENDELKLVKREIPYRFKYLALVIGDMIENDEPIHIEHIKISK